MKYLIVSDIHGSLPRLEKALSFFECEDYDMLLILGDILNYGPRNGIPEGLDAPGIAARLNAMAEKIVAVRGNCDSEVDQMLLRFPCMGDYCILVADGTRIMLTHGHHYNEDNVPAPGVDALFCGHTHLWKLERNADGILVCNTGSITFPKGGNVPTFATIDADGSVRMRGLDGNVLSEMALKNGTE